MIHGRTHSHHRGDTAPSRAGATGLKLGADPHHEIDTELDNHLEAEWAEQIGEQHAKAAAEADEPEIEL
jgi:hypothetical protein